MHEDNEKLSLNVFKSLQHLLFPLHIAELFLNLKRKLIYIDYLNKNCEEM